MDYPVHEPRCGMGKYRDFVRPEVEEKMITVTVTISTAIKIVRPGTPLFRGRGYGGNVTMPPVFCGKRLTGCGTLALSSKKTGNGSGCKGRLNPPQQTHNSGRCQKGWPDGPPVFTVRFCFPVILRVIQEFMIEAEHQPRTSQLEDR